MGNAVHDVPVCLSANVPTQKMLPSVLDLSTAIMLALGICSITLLKLGSDANKASLMIWGTGTSSVGLALGSQERVL
jgi:hypothetical protein